MSKSITVVLEYRVGTIKAEVADCQARVTPSQIIVESGTVREPTIGKRLTFPYRFDRRSGLPIPRAMFSSWRLADGELQRLK